MSKTKLITAVSGLVFSLSLSFLVYVMNANSKESSYEANIDALASIEWPWKKNHDCYESISAAPGMQVYYCPECRYINGCGDSDTLNKCYK